jgi:hypothetical protein
MEWARILAYIIGTVDQELLLHDEYLAAENRILKAQLQGAFGALRRRASDARRNRRSAGPQGPRRDDDCRSARHRYGVVPKARRPQIRWVACTSSPGQAADQ